MSTAYCVAPGGLYTGSKPETDEAYKRFVRSHSCAVCAASWGIESAHSGSHGLGQKSSDRNVIPLCRKHHRTGNESLHKLGPVRFEAVHNINVAALRVELNSEYDRRFVAKRKPEARRETTT